MYEGVTTAVKMKDGENDGFEVKVGVHQGLVLSPLLFIIVMEALSGEFHVGLPWELFYADDFCLLAATKEDLMVKIKRWKEGMESKGLRVNMGKTKVMYCNVGSGQMENSGKWPCGVCRKGVGANSIVCTVCQQWFHRRCSGLSGSLCVVVGFKCSRCVEGTWREETMKEVGVDHVGKLECVSEFCYS
jgi:hypothetical protein